MCTQSAGQPVIRFVETKEYCFLGANKIFVASFHWDFSSYSCFWGSLLKKCIKKLKSNLFIFVLCSFLGRVSYNIMDFLYCCAYRYLYLYISSDFTCFAMEINLPLWLFLIIIYVIYIKDNWYCFFNCLLIYEKSLNDRNEWQLTGKNYRFF